MKNKKSMFILLFTIFIIMIVYSGCNSKRVSSGVVKNTDKSSSSVSNKSGNDTGDTKSNSFQSSSKGPVIQKPDDDGQNKKPDYLNMTVFYTDYSDLFHFDKNCPNIKKGAVVKSGKLSEVIKLGHKIPCKVCIPKY